MLNVVKISNTELHIWFLIIPEQRFAYGILNRRLCGSQFMVKVRHILHIVSSLKKDLLMQLVKRAKDRVREWVSCCFNPFQQYFSYLRRTKDIDSVGHNTYFYKKNNTKNESSLSTFYVIHGFININSIHWILLRKCSSSYSCLCT